MIFSTQGRLALIKPEFRDDLFAYLGGIIREMRGTALIINGAADHVHLLVRIRPAQSAAEIARVIKTNSSGWVRAKWKSDFAWQTGYGVFSVSESNVAAVTKYIASQEEHHKKHSFQEELSGVPQEEQCGLRCEISLGLVSAAPSGLHTVRTLTHGWRRGLYSYAASRLDSLFWPCLSALRGLSIRMTTHG